MRATGSSGETSGSLGVRGTPDFGGVPSADWTSRNSGVAGIYSTAPGFLGAERPWNAPEDEARFTRADMAELCDEVPMGVFGIVPCKVSAENGPIRIGDLLVTAGTPGHAMRDDEPRVGNVLLTLQ